MRKLPLLTRRRVFQLTLAGTACGLLPGVSLAGQARATLAAGARRGRAAVAGAGRWLELANTHTGEALSVAYRSSAGFVTGALGSLEHLLRDHRLNEQHPIDPLLYDQLADLALAAGAEPRFEVISGYRSPRTNQELAELGHGVARHSLHMEGRAIDVRLKGVSCGRLRDLALDAGRGGVGYYRRSDFVHIDTGPPRTWTG